jgi:hypothetical protein
VPPGPPAVEPQSTDRRGGASRQLPIKMNPVYFIADINQAPVLPAC